LRYRSPDLRAFELSLRGHYDRCVVFETETCSIGSSNGSSLSYDDGGKDLFPKAGGAFHDCYHHHVPNARRRDTSQSAMITADVDELQFFSASVIGTCHPISDR